MAFEMPAKTAQTAQSAASSEVKLRRNGHFCVCDCLTSDKAKLFGLIDQNSPLVRCTREEECRFKIDAAVGSDMVLCKQVMRSFGGAIETRDLLALAELPQTERDKIERILTYDSFLNPSFYIMHVTTKLITGSSDAGKPDSGKQSDFADIRDDLPHLAEA